jgi:flagellar basal-body rod protein FlgB
MNSISRQWLPQQDNKMLFREPINPSLDGNTVELSVEQMEFSENVTRYQTTLTFLNNRITGLMSAIRGE